MRMPTEEKKEDKMKKPGTAETLLLLVKAIEGLEKKLDTILESVVVKPKDFILPLDSEKVSTTVANKPEPVIPFPHEWRAIIDSVLNTKFDSSVRYQDNGKFEITILVPKEYSNATSREWDTVGADRRIKIMDNHLGAQGVRDYCNLVAENLGAEIRAKIADDKAKFIT